MNLLRQVALERSAVLEQLAQKSPPSKAPSSTFSDEDLKSRLTPLQYEVTQLKGTEKRFSGDFIRKTEEGRFSCVVCNQDLFLTKHKFNSGSGWPSFSDVISHGRVSLVKDVSHGMFRYEVKCSACRAHLGHVFDDGPKPSGLRYCVNSAALNFLPEKTTETI